MLRYLFVILFICFAGPVLSQDQIQTERLNLSATSNVLDRGIWQIESGFRYHGTSRGYYNQFYLQSPILQQRFGLLKNVELRLAISNGNRFARNKGAYSANYYLSGFEAPVVGTKIKLLNQKRFLPQIAVLADATITPLASSLFRSKRVKPNLQFLFSHKINDKFLAGYNLGSFWNDKFYYTYDVYLQKKWGNRLLTNIEYAGYISKANEMPNNKQSQVFGSLGYYIGNNVLADFGLGRGVGNKPDFMLKAGFSFIILN